MTIPMNAETHPLFDLSSHYRACSQEKVWVDGGVKSVQGYFLQLHRNRLLEAWQSETIPKGPQPWGYTPEVNRKFHEVLNRGRQRALEEVAEQEQEAMSLVPLRGGAWAESLTPALVTFDLRQAGSVVNKGVERSPRTLFTGVGTVPRPNLNIEDNRFSVAIGGLPENHWCMFLLLDVSLVERLAVALEDEALEAFLGDESRVPPSLGTQEQIVGAIERALAARKLQPPADAGWAAHGAASQRSMLLSLAPGLEGVTTDKGWFERTVELGAPRPYPNLGTFLVCCIGPEHRQEG